MDPLTVLAVLGPLAVDLGKNLISRFIQNGEFKPASIDDYIKMRAIDLDMFRAMNEAGGSNLSYPWVEAVTRLMRPAVATVVLGLWAYQHAKYPVGIDHASLDNFAGAVGFYLFGDRTLFYSRKSSK